MTNQAIPEPASVCDSCGERTATPSPCEDCRAWMVRAATQTLADGWQLSAGQGRFLLDEIGRLRDTIARRGEEYDGVRAALEIEYGNACNAEIARDDAEERARYHQNKRSAEVRELAALRANHNRLAVQVQRVRDLTVLGAPDDYESDDHKVSVADIRRALDGGVS